jgi:transposase
VNLFDNLAELYSRYGVLKKISDETLAFVRFLCMEKKYSIREIAKKAKVSKSTVARYLKTPNETRQKYIQGANMHC